MVARTLSSLAVLATLVGVAPSHAQARAPVSGGALVPAAPARSAAPATVRILTLTWTEIQVPARLLAPPAPSVAGQPSEPLWFTLTWQPAPRRAAEIVSVTDAAPQCTVVRLVTVPCD
jgi:hypothetical protein